MGFIRFAVLIVALVAGVVHGSGFMTGKDYVYRYNGTIFTFFSKSIPMKAGTSFTSNVLIQHKSDDEFVFKIDGFKIASANKIAERFQDLTFDYQEMPRFSGFLEKPFKVQLYEGKVRSFQVFKDEPFFLVNIKRGLLSFFHLNLDAKNQIQIHSGMHTIDQDIMDRHFSVMEDGIFGECETSYEIQSEPYHLKPQHNHVLNVTKVRNYDNCRHTPYRFYSTFHGYECVDCEADRAHPLHNVAIYRYNLRGDRYNFLIEKATSDEGVTYDPHTVKGQTAKILTRRDLELIEIRPMAEEFSVKGDLEFFNKLTFEFPEKEDFYHPADLKNPHYMFKYLGMKFTADQIMNIFEDIVGYYKESPYISTVDKTSVTGRFVELIRAFQTLGYDEINEVYERIRSKDKSYRALFFDLLGVVGTNPAFAFGKHLIMDENVPEMISKPFLSKLAFHMKEPTEVFFTEFFTLCQHPNVKKSEGLERICLMTFSSLLHDACVEVDKESLPHRSSGRKYCDIEFVNKYLHYFKIPTTPGSRDNYRKLLNIRILGNLGVRNVIPMLKPFIYGEMPISSPLRSTAVFGLSRVSHSHPEEVLSILLPVFYNQTEDHEIRIASFIVLMQCHPPLYQLELMARSLYRENNRQVISMVFHTLKELGNSKYPCHRRCAKDALFAFRILERYPKMNGEFQFGDSSNYIFSGYNREFDFGGFTQFSYIASNSSYIPRNAYIGLNHYVSGRTFQSLAFGFQARGLEKYFDNFFGPKAERAHRHARSTGTVEKELKEIDERLHIKERSYEPLHFHFFMSIFGEEVNFMYLNDSHVQAMLRNSDKFLFDNPFSRDAFEYHRFMLSEDRVLSYPTEFGLPVVIDMKLPQYVHYHNNKFELNVKPDDFKQKGLKSTEQVLMNIDGTLEYDRDMYTHIAVVFPSMRSIGGVGVQTRTSVSLPLKMNLNMDLENHKLNLKMKPVRHDLFVRKVQPYSYFDSYANYVPVIHEEQYRPIFKDDHRFEKNFFHDYLGFGFTVKGKYEDHSNTYGDFLKFLGTNSLRDLLYYYVHQPNINAHELRVSVTPANRDMTNEVEATFDYDHHNYDLKEYTPFVSETYDTGNEYYDPARSERRTKSYVLKSNIIGRGQKERQLKTEMSYTYSRDNLFHKIGLFYDRTPFHQSETKNFKICLSGKMKFPNYDLAKIFMHKYDELDHKVDGYMDIFFGDDCKTDKKIAMHIQFDKTEEQLMLERIRDQPVTYERYNPFAITFQKCMKDRQNGKIYSMNCDHHLHMSTQLRKATLDITYEKLTGVFKNNAHKFDDFLKFVYYPYMTNDVLVNNEEGKIRVVANMTVFEPIKADVRFFEPHENTFFTNIPVVISRPISTYPLAHHTLFEQYSSFFEYPHCSFEGGFIQTFDNVSYTPGITDCFQVLAKDCSPNEDFAILSAKLPYTKYKKSLKMFLGKYKIEILPVSEEAGLIVRVNGKKVPVSTNEGYYEYMTEMGKEIEAFHVVFNGFYYKIQSDRHGLFVFYDGNGIYTQLSRYYLGKVCGLCGTFNLERQNEFMGPEGCVYKDPVSFGYSYAVPADGCTVPKIEIPCMAERAPGCTRLRNQYVYLGTRNRQMCFSTAPLPECAEGCVAHGTVVRKVGFHCLAAKDDFTRYLQKESQRRILTEVARKSEDHYAEVEYPESCHRVE